MSANTEEKVTAEAQEQPTETVQEQEIPVQEEVREKTPAAEEQQPKKGFFKKDGKKDKGRIEELEKKVAELEEKVAKEKDDYIRLMAEFDNYRRRTSQEKLELVSMASTDTIKGLLPVLDDCERALKVLLESDDSDAAKEGTELIYSKLMAYLKTKGLAVIDAMNQPFDTDLHEAVAQFPVQEEEQKGKVFDVVQTGYTLNGKVIRFAKVVVGI
ncbi:MAG: nucleotide exchange factor GrpE [Bacteroidales bacterium]|nr:nucleotide exchange factor GrpE [Bacteroidales bacterium]